MTVTYRIALALAWVFVKGYGRLTVVGAEEIPRSRSVLIIANHDSPLDAFIIGVAVGKRRQVRVLTKRSLWRYRPLGFMLDKLHQIPIDRGRQDATGLDAATIALRAGHCVCVFPEGTISRGQRLRVRSGAARLLVSAPEAVLVGSAVTGALALKRLRFRARVNVVFFVASRDTSLGTYEVAAGMVSETMNAIRAIVPPAR